MSKRQKGKILIVDDLQNWRELLVEILQEDGHQTTTAKNYKEASALLKARANEFDIAVIDMRLIDDSPYNNDGMKVLKDAKELNPLIKAIILTGYPDKDQEYKSLKYYQADDYKRKVPKGTSFDIDEFSGFIFNLLQSQTASV